MKMIPGTGTASNYGSYINNCQSGQMPYQLPIGSLADLQLYIDIGPTEPSAVQYEIVDTCGGAFIDTLAAPDYVVGQDTNGNWYGVFRNFTGSTPTCFVIAITLTIGGTDKIFFSEEYCREVVCNAAGALVLIKGCYGHPNNLIAYDCEGLYYGTPLGAVIGDSTILYEHQMLLRNVEVRLGSIKNSFKQGRTRTFRTEKEKLYNFNSEWIPEWYLPEIDAVLTRGEVYIGATKYLLAETEYELVEECKRIWKPAASFKESCFKSFTCEADPCAVAPAVCCDPEFIGVTVSDVPYESGFPPFESGSGTIPVRFGDTVVVQAVVDGAISITGTIEPVTGITGGSVTVTCADFAGVRVVVERGNIQIPGIDPGDGSNYYTKVLADDFITFSGPLIPGEFIYIQTIP